MMKQKRKPIMEIIWEASVRGVYVNTSKDLNRDQTLTFFFYPEVRYVSVYTAHLEEAAFFHIIT